MKPFLTDRPKINTPTLNVAQPVPFLAAATGVKSAPAPARPGSHSHGAGGSAVASKVDCVRQGDRVTRIIVTCGCGERIEIDCLYAAET